MPRRFFSCGVGQGPVLHPASYRQVCRHGRTLGSGPGEDGAETSAKGTLRPASCWLSPLTLLCVHPVRLPGATPLWSSLHFPGCAAGGPSLQSALGEPLSLPLLQDVGITSGVQAPGRDVLPRSKCGGVFQATHPSPCPALGERQAHRRVTALPQSRSLPHSPSSTCHPERWGGSCCQARLQGRLGLHRHSAAGSHGLVGIAASPRAGLRGSASLQGWGDSSVPFCVGMSRVETPVSGRDRCDRSGEPHQGP